MCDNYFKLYSIEFEEIDIQHGPKIIIKSSFPQKEHEPISIPNLENQGQSFKAVQFSNPNDFETQRISL